MSGKDSLCWRGRDTLIAATADSMRVVRSASRVMRPVATQQQLVDRVLAKVVQFADRKEEPGREPLRVDRAEDEWGVAESAELFAERVASSGRFDAGASVISLRR